MSLFDGGMNHFVRPVFHEFQLSRTYFQEERVFLRIVNIGGRLCTPFDIIAKDVVLPRPRSEIF